MREQHLGRRAEPLEQRRPLLDLSGAGEAPGRWGAARTAVRAGWSAVECGGEGPFRAVGRGETAQARSERRSSTPKTIDLPRSPPDLARLHVKDAIFALGAALDGAAAAVVHQLHAVADAEDREPHLEDLGVVLGRVVRVHGRAAARDDERGVAVPAQVLGGCVEGQQLALDLELAEAAVDHLAVLRAGVQDRHALGVGGGGRAHICRAERSERVSAPIKKYGLRGEGRPGRAATQGVAYDGRRSRGRRCTRERAAWEATRPRRWQAKRGGATRLAGASERAAAVRWRPWRGREDAPGCWGGARARGAGRCRLTSPAMRVWTGAAGAKGEAASFSFFCERSSTGPKSH